MSSHPALKLLSSYLDEEVTPAQLQLVEQHLDECSDCRGTVAGLRTVAQGVRRLEAVAPPATLATAVERRVLRSSLQGTRGSRVEESLRRWMAQPVLAPIFAIVLALGSILYLFAVGVARDESRGTRFIVAAAPSEESARSEATAPSAQPTSGVLSKPFADELAEPPASTGPGEPDPAKDSESKGQAVPERKSEVREQRFQSAAPARRTAAPLGTSAAVAGPAPELQSSAPAVEPVEIREIAGRRFQLEGDIWVEVGLEDEGPVEILEAQSDSTELDAELEPFRELRRARLRLGDRIVEFRVGDAEPRK